MRNTDIENHDHDHDHEEHEPRIHAIPKVDPNKDKKKDFQDLISPEGQTVTAAASIDISQAFLLHSQPGATKTIYLDFNGHTTSGTPWNSNYSGGADIVTPAYDFDGNIASFSTSELQRIIYIWQRVAEDFSPFDVNVTTQDPGVEALKNTGSGDTAWGVRVAIGGSSSDWYGSSAGGVAYINSFNWNTDTPTYVFEAQLGNGNEKYTAEAISHEVGHTLKLYHDGTSTTGYYQGHGSGNTGWAPIMGVGYYQPLTQWSKGEYADANNLEDDLAIISTNNGFTYRTDAHGNTLATATPLTTSGSNVSGSGIIEKNTDSDVFSFYTGAGIVGLNILPFERSPNLDILAELYNSTGNLVASSNPLDFLDASFNQNLAAGEYYVKVTGTGKDGVYSNYASLGQYSINGTIVIPQDDFLSIQPTNADQNEGNLNTTPFTFTVTRAGNLNKTTSVEYTVTGTGANPAATNDFTGASGVIQFGINETAKVVTVDAIGDTEIENDEQFTVTLLNQPEGTFISNPSAVGTIRNDDLPPTIAISPTNISKNEGNSGTTAYQFTVSLNEASEQVITVQYLTNDGTAKLENNDYLATNGTLTFNPGQPLSQTVTVLVNGDTALESNEQFTVSIVNPTNAILGSNTATGTIVNDDTPPTLAINDVSVSEGAGTASFTVTRSGDSSGVTTVTYSTANGSGKTAAKSGSDYIAQSNKLITFNSGETTKNISISLINDTISEPNEQFFVNLSNAQNATIADSKGIGTILNDDAAGGKKSNPVGQNLEAIAPSKKDVLIGTKANDTFILGDENQVFYTSEKYAEIKKFDLKKDFIQLHGTASDYVLGASPFKSKDTGIFFDNAGTQDLIGVLTKTTGLDLTSSNFIYV